MAGFIARRAIVPLRPLRAPSPSEGRGAICRNCQLIVSIYIAFIVSNFARRVFATTIFDDDVDDGCPFRLARRTLFPRLFFHAR
jgi:hypothetical protein